jgi:hypothetical protein
MVEPKYGDNTKRLMELYHMYSEKLSFIEFEAIVSDAYTKYESLLEERVKSETAEYLRGMINQTVLYEYLPSELKRVCEDKEREKDGRK